MLGKGTAPYPRRRYRHALHRWLVTNWLPVTVTAFCFAVAGATSAVLLRGYLLGAAHGVLLGLLMLAIATSFLVHTNATGQLAGAWGEEFTREELAKAKRRRLIWGWVDSLESNGADVDHLVVLRSGSVLAIDSKWRRDAHDLDRLESDALAAKRAARRAAGILHHLGSTRSVQALVVVWGSAATDVHGRKVGGIEFVSGRKLRSWLRQHHTARCDQATAATLLDNMRAYRDPATRPKTPTLSA